MAKRRSFWTGLLAVIGMAVLILDSKTALSGAKDGILLCLYTVIPSLFPFLVLSSVINSALTGKSIPLLRPVGQLCGIPAGCESLLVLGLVGGYPVGAQGVRDAYQSNALQASTARRMLGFCNNAGPSFIFGMLSGLFSSPAIAWVLWLIQIVSAIVVGAILPNKDARKVQLTRGKPVTLPKALRNGLQSMASICGWVILFRILLAISSRWFLWVFPVSLQAAITGCLELANGCCGLTAIPEESMRFLLSSAFLSFGGLCVMMQTMSVTHGLGLGLYITGKFLQTLISILLAGIFQRILFPLESALHPFLLMLIVGVFILYAIILQRKK